MRQRFQNLALVLLLPLTACSGAKILNSFPSPVVPTEGAVAFKYKAIHDMPLARPFQLSFVFYRPGEPMLHAGTYRKVAGISDDLGFEVEEIVLISLPPGEYLLTIGSINWSKGPGDSQMLIFDLDRPGGAFGKIVVEPGKAVVLGKLDLLVKIEMNAEGSAYTWKDSKTKWDDRAVTRKAVARAALEDGRARKTKWDEVIEASLASLD